MTNLEYQLYVEGLEKLLEISTLRDALENFHGNELYNDEAIMKILKEITERLYEEDVNYHDFGKAIPGFINHIAPLNPAEIEIIKKCSCEDYEMIGDYETVSQDNYDPLMLYWWARIVQLISDLIREAYPRYF